MSEVGTQTFSEHWHRVGGQRVALRPGVNVKEQWFRGEKWFVLHEPFNSQFHRVSPAAWHFIARLDGLRTVEEAWQETMAADGDDAPGQEEVIALLAQLYQVNFLRGEIAADSAMLFQRYQKRRQRETQSVLGNLMFPQIPLFDPDRWLKRMMPVGRAIFSRWGGVAWIGIIGWAVKMALDHAGELTSQGRNVLAPGNLVALYAALFVIKGIHEAGHALACRSFGAEVHRIGLSLVFLTPLPYVDATGSWAFRNRWQRILVSSAGMYFEFFAAAIAMFVWAGTGAGTLHAVAFNAMCVASVTTLLFNANPLLRYDGYYILSDLVEIPNLNTRAFAMLRYLGERYLLGSRQVGSPAHSVGEAWLVGAYGVVSSVYRVVLFSGILWIISGKWLLLGVVLAAGCAVKWVVAPPVKLARYLVRSPALARCRPRAIAVSAGGLALVLAVVCLIPVPEHFRAPGMVEAGQFDRIFAQGAGVVESVDVKSGSVVKKGQVIARLRNAELMLELDAARSGQAQTLAEKEKALDQSPEELEPLNLRMDADKKEIARLEGQIAALVITSPADGVWFSRVLENAKGEWVLRGEEIGDLVQAGAWNFRAVVPQSHSRALFAEELRTAEVRLPGAGGVRIPVQSFHVIPAKQEILPTAALGWRGGGPVEVDAHEADGKHAAEPFFEVRAVLADGEDALLREGRTGFIRFALPPRPLAVQLWRRAGQLLQERSAW